MGLAPGHHLRIALPVGQHEVDAAGAAALAMVFGRELRRLRDEGVREAHLFMAVPAALAVLMGAAVHAGPAMTLYHSEDGNYVCGVRLTG